MEMKQTLGFLFGLSLALAVPAGAAFAQSGALPDAAPKVTASFVPERKAIAPGQAVTVALREVIRKEWHTYWVNPGDSGAPTEIQWHLPPGWEAGSIQWPYPKRLPVGPLMNFGYEDEVSLLVDVKAPADARPGDTVMLDADVNWLVCSDVCVPEETKLSLPLTVAEALPPPDSENASLFAEARSKLPHASPWQAVYDAGDARFALLIKSPELVSAQPREAVFYPAADGMAEAASPQRVGTTADGLVIESTTGWKMKTAEKRAAVDKVAGLLVLTSADGRTDALEIEASPGAVPAIAVALPALSDVGLLQALVFAFLGGLILNLMPCVFPVLSMKALALAAKREAPEEAHKAALSYGAGVLLSFLGLAGALLALRAGGEAIGWGFQLQHPMFITGLALLMFAVGLNLSGVFEIGAGVAGVGQSLANKNGVIGSFFTGVLAVVVATPCTAPFMGAAMGFALTQNAVLSLAVFAALGLGFAAPFMAIGFSPRALRMLPRPGAWMGVFRQVLAFPMYGAAIWLVWVLSFQSGSDGVLAALAAALALAFALWAYGMSQQASGRGRMASLAVALLGLIVTGVAAPYAGAGGAPVSSAGASAQGESVLGYEPYTAAKLESLRGEGRPVFVNATAAWCITCLVNERVALSGENLKHVFDDKKIAALKADWTNQDPEITKLLAGEGRSGVPLYLYYAPGAAKPVVLPQLLTEATVLAAIEH